jgi:hypothetical protein
MPVHDWTRVDAAIFDDFHTAWIASLRTALNRGPLPPGYYALAAQAAPDALVRHRNVAIRHLSGHRLVALLEIMSPANKDCAEHVEDFVAKAGAALDLGVHLLLVDIFRPGSHDPHGMASTIWQRLVDPAKPYDLPADQPLTLAAYAAGPHVQMYLEHLAIGASLPEMPLFVRPDCYVKAPLESTYQEAYRGMPAFWRDVLEGRPPVLP